MGLFWNKNKYDICPKQEDLKCLVTNYSGARGVVKINAKLVVPDGYFFVLGKNGKVADKFETGEYFLNFANLPYMCRKFGIDKIQDGKQKDKFSAEQYFVDKNLHAGKFKTYRKVEMGTKAYGIFKAHVFGVYSYKVGNVQEFMQSLLNEYDFIKTGEAEELIEAWVNDLIVDVLEKNNFMLDDVINNNPIIAEKLKLAISKLFNTAGLELCDVRIYKYKLPSKYQEASDNAIKAQEEKLKQQEQEIVAQTETVAENTSQNEELNENVFEENKVLVNNQEIKYNEKLNEQNNEEQSSINSEPIDEYVPFGNFKIEEKTQGEIQIKSVEPKKKEKTFVDLNLDRLYTHSTTTKRCLNCGGENNILAKHCSLCGEEFVE
ncbi:MAG: hypothetical protein E7376_01660 [Clostridiales bacterium]|nr:hypothetical protein [Clostridiales bacterium]